MQNDKRASPHLTDYLIFDGTPKASTWKGLKAYVTNPLRPKADFMGFGAGTLVVSDEAVSQVRHFLEMAGELLPIEVEDTGHCYLLNVTECFNSLDRERTQWILAKDTGYPIKIEKYRFHGNRFPESSIFKIPETAKAEILVIERNCEPEDEFTAFYEKHEMTGLKFADVWASAASQL